MKKTFKTPINGISIYVIRTIFVLLIGNYFLNLSFPNYQKIYFTLITLLSALLIILINPLTIILYDCLLKKEKLYHNNIYKFLLVFALIAEILIFKFLYSDVLIKNYFYDYWILIFVAFVMQVITYELLSKYKIKNILKILVFSIFTLISYIGLALIFIGNIGFIIICWNGCYW